MNDSAKQRSRYLAYIRTECLVVRLWVLMVLPVLEAVESFRRLTDGE